MLEVDGLTVRYGKRLVLRGVSLSVKGEKVLLIGPNGSGKSTLFKAALGLVPKEGGTISVFGSEVEEAEGILNVSTNIEDVYRLLNLNVGDLISLYSELKGVGNARAFELIREFELEDVLSRKLYQLSEGQKKMVCNIIALSSNPDLLLLDEPFESVDQSRRRRLIELLNQTKAEVLMSTHELHLVKHFSGWKLYFMLEGRVWGKFDASELERLYISRGRVENALSVMETSQGVFSITLDRGEVKVSSATNLSSLLESAAE